MGEENEKVAQIPIFTEELAMLLRQGKDTSDFYRLDVHPAR